MRNIALFCVLVFMGSCGSEYQHDFSEEQISEALRTYNTRPVVIQKDGLVLKEIIDIPPFEDVSLELMHKNVKFRQGVNKLEFKANKFTLGAKTVAEEEVGLTTENKGQYLMVVGSNTEENVSGHVESNFELGTNYLLSFLCRSYGISLKSERCYTFHEIEVNDLDGRISQNTATPYLCLNSPEKDEILTSYDPVLLDFYLVNFTVGEKGNYLKLMIDNTEFKLRKWSAFAVEGLSVGKHTFSLEAYSKDGKVLSGKLLKAVRAEVEITEGLVFE